MNFKVEMPTDEKLDKDYQKVIEEVNRILYKLSEAKEKFTKDALTTLCPRGAKSRTAKWGPGEGGICTRCVEHLPEWCSIHKAACENDKCRLKTNRVNDDLCPECRRALTK